MGTVILGSVFKSARKNKKIQCAETTVSDFYIAGEPNL